MEVNVKLGEKWWKNSKGIRINNDIERKLEVLKSWTEEKVGNTRVLIEGEFNARTETKKGGLKELS